MIRHVVMFTLKDRRELESIVASLQRLGTIPGSTHFEVSANLKADQIGNDIDIVVYGEFPDLTALKAYKQHPTYAETTKAVQPRRELRFAADFAANKTSSQA